MIKSILASLYNSLGLLHRRLEQSSKNNYVILTYHRILLDKGVKMVAQAGMYVKPDTFKDHIRFLQEHFKIVPFSAILSDYQENIDRPNDKPLCVLTFDDGWHDVFKYAFPILREHEVPATVFLPTYYIGSDRWFWTDRLSYLFLQNENRHKSSRQNMPLGDSIVKRLDGLKGSFESRLETSIEMLKGFRNDEIEEVLSELSAMWDINAGPQGRAFLSWEEVSEMAKSGIVSYGSHTHTHPILTTLTDKEIQGELIRSKEKLISEKAVKSSFIPFCYPDGNYNDIIAGMVKEAGYGLAVTTENGWNHSASDPFALRRVSIHQDMTSTRAMFGCRLLGIF